MVAPRQMPLVTRLTSTSRVVLSGAANVHSKGTHHRFANPGSALRMLLCFRLAMGLQDSSWWEMLSMAVAVNWRLLQLSSGVPRGESQPDAVLIYVEDLEEAQDVSTSSAGPQPAHLDQVAAPVYQAPA